MDIFFTIVYTRQSKTTKLNQFGTYQIWLVLGDTSTNNNDEESDEVKDKVKPSSSVNMAFDVGNDLSGDMDLDL